MSRPPVVDAPADTAPRTVAVRVLQGMGMGAADVVPGVSGGTVALILGIYQRLVGAIRTLSLAPGHLVRGDRAGAGAAVRAVPWAFVLPVGLGLLGALGIGSVVLPPLLESYPAQTGALFIGLIVASLQVPWGEAVDDGRLGMPAMLGTAVAAAVAAFLLTGLPELVVEHPPLWRVLISAMVAICAMILPGVSGAFLLLAMGIYEPTLEAVSDRNLPYIATFAVGAVVGVGAFSRVLSHLLEHRRGVTMAALTGLMVGALRRLWPWGGAEGHLDAPPDLGAVLVALGFAGVGFLIVHLLLRAGRGRTAPGTLPPPTAS